jgi:hypothetical protein
VDDRRPRQYCVDRAEDEAGRFLVYRAGLEPSHLWVYAENVSIVSILKAIGRKLTPPGNRGSLDTEYRQPNADPNHQQSVAGAVQHQADQWGGGV